MDQNVSIHRCLRQHRNNDKNFFSYQANQTPQEFPLNVDVQEFYPRVHTTSNESDTNVNCNQATADLERTKKSSSPKPKVEAPKATKTSHLLKPSNGRVSKKEIIEGIKSMEQQNIDLMATKHQTIKNVSHDDEWNVIKKGKKVKVVKDIQIDLSASDVKEAKQEIVQEIKTEIVAVPEVVKKPSPAPTKSKKPKNKNGKKKKSHLMAKQNGFEIIEPEFNHAPVNEADADEMSQEASDEETVVEVDALSATCESETVENLVLSNAEATDEPVAVAENEIAAVKVEETLRMPEASEEKTPEVTDLREIIKNVRNDDDAVIDISDEDIFPRVENICLKAPPEVIEKKDQVQVEAKPELVKESTVSEKPEVPLKVKFNTKPETQLPVEAKAEVQLTAEPQIFMDPFQDSDYFSNRLNIAALERDLMENLRMLDDDFDLKSPIINPLYDFPITSAVRKWLQAKQSESFDSLFHMQNLKKLSEFYDDDEDETESNISDKGAKSETDSDYASDSHAKANGGSPTCSTHAKGSSEKSSKCNKLLAKESFCALM